MKLLSLFGKKPDASPPESEKENDVEKLGIYTGMRVEVIGFDGRILFVAKLMGLHRNQAELYQYSESAVSQEEEKEPFAVKIRGYSDHTRKAVYMEGVIAPLSQDKWSVSELKICRVGNDRAFFRLQTNLDATTTMFSGLAMGEKPCKLLNISIGGAYIRSETQYYEGDKFLLKVRLLEGRPESVMFSQVVRVIEKEDGGFEYGCQFLELTEADQDRITQNIFAVQRQKREHS